jgi:hypothetical protein
MALWRRAPPPLAPGAKRPRFARLGGQTIAPQSIRQLQAQAARKLTRTSAAACFAYSHPPVVALSILRSMNSRLDCSQNR